MLIDLFVSAVELDMKVVALVEVLMKVSVIGLAVVVMVIPLVCTAPVGTISTLS